MSASFDASMASLELTDSTQHSEKEDRLDATLVDPQSIKGVNPSTDGSSGLGTGPVERSRDASPASLYSASGLSSTKGGTQSPAPTGNASSPPLSMPHPKKFSHVNINKKFLEKTSTSTPTYSISASPVVKAAHSSRTYYNM